MELYSPKKLDDTPLGETECLSNRKTLLVAKASSFLIHPFSLIYRLPLTQLLRLPELPTTYCAALL